MFDRILVGFDGSAQSRKALSAALELSSRVKAQIEAAIVIHPPDFAELEAEVQVAVKEANGALKEAIEWAHREAQKYRVDLQIHKHLGHPAEMLVRLAEEGRFDLIVVGRRGRSAVARWTLGSISDRVLRYAHCPVMVVH